MGHSRPPALSLIYHMAQGICVREHCSRISAEVNRSGIILGRRIFAWQYVHPEPGSRGATIQGLTLQMVRRGSHVLSFSTSPCLSLQRQAWEGHSSPAACPGIAIFVLMLCVCLPTSYTLAPTCALVHFEQSPCLAWLSDVTSKHPANPAPKPFVHSH